MTVVSRLGVTGLLFFGFALACMGSDSGPKDCASSDRSQRSDCAVQKQDSEKKTPKIKHEETIVVTGTFAPTPMEDVDRAVTVIDAKAAPLLYTNWVNYLAMDPSVDLQQRAPGDVQADLTIRGINLWADACHAEWSADERRAKRSSQHGPAGPDFGD